MGISKSYLKDKFQKKQSFQAGGQPKSFPLKPEEMYWNNKNLGKSPYKKQEFNAQLVPGGSPAVQKYQKMLNDKYGLYLQEEGAWGPKTQAAYQKYIINKETPTFTPSIYSSKNFESAPNNPRGSYVFDDKGKIYLQKESGAMEEVTRTKPTVEEFKNIVERGKFNYGYESKYDVDPTKVGVQAGPLSKERGEEASATYSPSNEQKLKEDYFGKTFGGLPFFSTSTSAGGIYQGYSPTRIWSGRSPYYERRDNINTSNVSNPNFSRYAYFLYPKDENIAKQWFDTPRFSDMGDLFNEEGFYTQPTVKDPKTLKAMFNYAKENNQLPSSLKDKNPEEFTPGQWMDSLNKMQMSGYDYNVPFASQSPEKIRMTGEMQKNPEIIEYAKKNNIDLEKLTTNIGWAPMAEAIASLRNAKATGIPVGQGPWSGDRSPVIQDPDQFNLVGYLPIINSGVEEMPYKDWEDPEKRKEYARKAGVPENMLDRTFIHTSPFPIQEYKPLKNKEGQIYKIGGKVKSKLKTSYKNKRG